MPIIFTPLPHPIHTQQERIILLSKWWEFGGYFIILSQSTFSTTKCTTPSHAKYIHLLQQQLKASGYNLWSTSPQAEFLSLFESMITKEIRHLSFTYYYYYFQCINQGYEAQGKVSISTSRTLKSSNFKFTS